MVDDHLQLHTSQFVQQSKEAVEPTMHISVARFIFQHFFLLQPKSAKTKSNSIKKPEATIAEEKISAVTFGTVSFTAALIFCSLASTTFGAYFLEVGHNLNLFDFFKRG